MKIQKYKIQNIVLYLDWCTATGRFYPWVSDHLSSSGWATTSLTLTMQIIPGEVHSQDDHGDDGGGGGSDDYDGDNANFTAW